MDFDVNDFRKRYPEMTPWVGEGYEVAKMHHCALLVIGESHYLPKNSTVHRDCERWYASNNTMLNDEEKGWISTRDIIADELPNDFPNQAHGIWKYGYRKINQWGPQFEDYRNLFQYTVFYNFYLRPANEGDTFKNLCTSHDNAIANEYFDFMVGQYNPDGIIFISRFAFESCTGKNRLTIPVAGAPHPTCRWWNKSCGKYGGRYGRDLVQDGMVGMDWRWTRSI